MYRRQGSYRWVFDVDSHPSQSSAPSKSYHVLCCTPTNWCLNHWMIPLEHTTTYTRMVGIEPLLQHSQYRVRAKVAISWTDLVPMKGIWTVLSWEQFDGPSHITYPVQSWTPMESAYPFGIHWIMSVHSFFDIQYWTNVFMILYIKLPKKWKLSSLVGLIFWIISWNITIICVHFRCLWIR